MARHIVVGVDGSSYGDAAIDWAVRNMMHSDSDMLHLVCVINSFDGYANLSDMGLAYVPFTAEDQVSWKRLDSGQSLV
jgi:nucleotide-binding universal stress UspA family protein